MMNLMMLVELFLLTCQMGQLISLGSDNFCDKREFINWTALSCSGLISFMIIFNWAFAVLYMYSVSVVFEHYEIAQADKGLIAADVKFQVE